MYTEWRTYVDKAVTLTSTGYQTPFEGNLSALMYAQTNTFQDFWWYNGSLTTPPCSENVIWIIFHGGIEFSDDELELLHKHVFFEDFREPQSLNNRKVLRSYPKEDDSVLTDQYYCCNKQQPQSQSPVNIITSCTENHQFRSFSFSSYYSTTNNFILINNGHTIVATLQNQTQNNLLTLSGGDLSGVFLFQSFHLHWGQNAKQGDAFIKSIKCAISEACVKYEQSIIKLEAQTQHTNIRTKTTASNTSIWSPVAVIAAEKLRRSLNNASILSARRFVNLVHSANTLFNESSEEDENVFDAVNHHEIKIHATASTNSTLVLQQETSALPPIASFCDTKTTTSGIITQASFMSAGYPLTPC
ncbi:unnamed protein product [Didymodactylos carnosus]|uniref:carbonic anhydrase n=1 Tax=Didymodactylos carnosus TaxID=1234261 RepID=A0A814E0Y6_9BILA|nr:unnamed protein product [Didymodactylos carnosus]CAF3737488.1 unnamed protein product [Didymodactylos carnosus]